MPLSDSSATFMRALRPKPSPACVLLLAGGGRAPRSPGSCVTHEASGRVWGLRLRRTERGTRDIAPARVALHCQCKSVSVPDCYAFSELNTQPTCPLFTLRRTPRGVQRKTRGRAVRYSFLVGLFHSLLHAGLSRRNTALAILRSRREPRRPSGRNWMEEAYESCSLPQVWASGCHSN